MKDQKEAYTGGSGCLARIYWMFFGNVLLLCLLVFILQKRLTVPFLLDAVYGVVLASLIIVRYIEIRFLSGQTAAGEPATMSHWRRYALLVGAVGVGAWVLVRVFMR